MRGVYEKVKGSDDWYISYFDEYHRHHREHVGPFAEAVEIYNKTKRDIRVGKWITPTERKRKSPTFRELFEMRMAALKPTLAAKTFQHHEYEFNCARLDVLKELPACKIRPKDIQGVLSGLHEDEQSAGTIRNYRALISAVFAYGIKEEYLVSNPVLKTMQPKATKQKVRFLKKDEEETIRGKIREFWPEREAEFDLLLHSGMRSGEAYGLTWERIDLERGVIEVPDSGKTGWRDIPINSVCRKALETLHRQSHGSEFVIPRCGKRGNWILGKWFGDVVKKSGVLHATPHTLRHTFASRLVMAGVDLRTVQQFLGHSSILMTMRYAHLSPEHGKAAIEKLVSAEATTAPAKRPFRMRAAPAARSVKVA
jgi:integrase